MLLGQLDSNVYVYSGELKEDNIGGHGTGIVSSANTNAIYVGEWADSTPTGTGILTIWNKNEDFSKANIYEGKFTKGVLDGSTVFKTWIEESQVEANLEISQGNVNVNRVDDKGNVWLTENFVEAGYESAENNVIVDYTAGLPGFGGSDRILSVKILDTVPPVIKCNLKISKVLDSAYYVDEWYTGKNPIGKGITATDNVDGDLTAQIVNESRKISTSDGYYDDWCYGLVVVYSVTDSAGNKAQLTVTYDVDGACDYWEYRVVSVK